MAQLDTFKSTGRMPVGAPAARQPGYMQYGTGGQAQFFGQLSQEAFGIARRIQKADYEAQMARGTADRANLLNALDETLRGEANPEAFNTHFEAAYKQIEAISPTLTNGRARRDFQSELQTLKPQWQGTINAKSAEKRKVNVAATANYIADQITKHDPRGDTGKAEAMLMITRAVSGLAGIGYTKEQLSDYTEDRLADMEKREVLLDALDNVNVGNYENAIKRVESSVLEPEDKRSVMSEVDYIVNRKKRTDAAQLKQMREQVNSSMLADIWDEKPVTEDQITDALRYGYLDASDAKYLRGALKNPEPPKTTNEALIGMRYAIDGISQGTQTRESALKVLNSYVQQLSPADGKSFIKEIFGEHDTKNAFWNRQAQEYMEKQIMDVATITGVLYGSGEQLALSAKSLIAYDEAKKAAIAEGKPINGRDLLILAHEVMLPFRQKPFVEGEKIPESLSNKTKMQPTLPAPKTKAEYDKLKSGTKYIAPDGTERTKK